MGWEGAFEGGKGRERGIAVVQDEGIGQYRIGEYGG